MRRTTKLRPIVAVRLRYLSLAHEKAEEIVYAANDDGGS